MALQWTSPRKAEKLLTEWHYNGLALGVVN